MNALEQFALAVLKELQTDIIDLDGGELEDKAESLGLLVKIEAAEPCGELCHCAEWGEFPQECLRYSPEVQKMVDAK